MSTSAGHALLYNSRPAGRHTCVFLSPLYIHTLPAYTNETSLSLRESVYLRSAL